MVDPRGDLFQGLALIDGDTADLAAIARAAQAWHEGAALDDIRRAALFVHLNGRFEVPDDDSTHLTESERQHKCVEAVEQESRDPGYRPLVESAYAEPRLRALYPFTSHMVLHCSTTVGMPSPSPVTCAAD